MMKSYEFIIGVLAVWRLTHLLTNEDGPFDWIARLRRRVGGLMDCFYCLSLWIAAPFAALLSHSWREGLLVWPALSGAAILVNRLANRVAPDTPVFFEEPPPNEGGNE
jgi:hypothetical protein